MPLCLGCSGRGVVYHNDPAATAEAHLEPGVFTTGEIGYFDDDGYVYITDRAKEHGRVRRREPLSGRG